MPLHVALTHKTSYHYDRLVTLGPQTIRLRPAPQARTAILSYELKVEPKPHFINWMQDPQGNHLARVVFPEKVDRFEVTVDLVADMVTINPFDFFLEPEAETYPFTYDPRAGPGTCAVPQDRNAGPACWRRCWRRSRGTSSPRSTCWSALNTPGAAQGRLHRPAGTRRLHAGGDAGRRHADHAATSAWLLVQVLRHLGMAARFVSGYLIQLAARREAAGRPAGPVRPTSPTCTPGPRSTCPAPAGSGWTPPPACCAARAISRSPPAPTRSPPRRSPAWWKRPRSRSTSRCRSRRILETPRTTKPYTEAQWQAILARGAGGRSRADARRRAADHGRRADLHLRRRHGRARVEHRCARSDQARLCRAADPPADGPLVARARC